MKFYITSHDTITECANVPHAMTKFDEIRATDPLATLWCKDDENLYIYKPAHGTFYLFRQD